MEQFYPQALFSTTGMLTMFIIVLIIELLSIAFLGIVALGFRRLTDRHEQFFHVMANATEHEKIERVPRMIFWVYIASTLVVTLVTAYLFIFQPHLL